MILWIKNNISSGVIFLTVTFVVPVATAFKRGRSGSSESLAFAYGWKYFLSIHFKVSKGTSNIYDTKLIGNIALVFVFVLSYKEPNLK